MFALWTMLTIFSFCFTANSKEYSITRSDPDREKIEYRLLCVLAANAGKVMTHRHLMQEVWGPNHGERGHYLRIYMGHLRQKLEADPAQPVHLVTEPGVGYRFVSG